MRSKLLVAIFACLLLAGNLRAQSPVNNGQPGTPVNGGNVGQQFAPGTFTVGQNFFYFGMDLNACNPATAINAYNATVLASGSYTDAITGCTLLPNGLGTVTNTQQNGIEGIIINGNSQQQDQWPNGAGPSNAVAVNGLAYCTVGNANCEGLVGEVVDTAGQTGNAIVGSEVGLVSNNTSNHYYGYLASTFGNTQPTGDLAPAFDLHQGGGGTTTKWTSGFRCETGSLVLQITFYGPCVNLQPIATGNNKNSLSIEFFNTNSTGTFIASFLNTANDGTSNFPWPRWSSLANGAVAAATVALLPDSTVNVDLSSNAFISIGTVSVSASTSGSYNFKNQYNSAPNCSLTPTSSPASVGVYWVTSSVSAVTANVTNSGTITFIFVCGPTAN